MSIGVALKIGIIKNKHSIQKLLIAAQRRLALEEAVRLVPTMLAKVFAPMFAHTVRLV